MLTQMLPSQPRTSVRTIQAPRAGRVGLAVTTSALMVGSAAAAVLLDAPADAVGTTHGATLAVPGLAASPAAAVRPAPAPVPVAAPITDLGPAPAAPQVDGPARGATSDDDTATSPSRAETPSRVDAAPVRETVERAEPSPSSSPRSSAPSSGARVDERREQARERRAEYREEVREQTRERAEQRMREEIGRWMTERSGDASRDGSSAQPGSR